jgi:hypothetical protein
MPSASDFIAYKREKANVIGRRFVEQDTTMFRNTKVLASEIGKVVDPRLTVIAAHPVVRSPQRPQTRSTALAKSTVSFQSKF